MRILGTRLFQLALLAAAVIAVSASDALAFGWRHKAAKHGYGSAGSYGSYGSYGGYASAGSYGGYASAGSHGGGMFSRWHARKAAKHSYGGYGSHGSYGSYGGYASGGSYGGSYAVSYGGSSGSYGGYGSGGSYGGVIVDSYEGVPMDAQPAVPGGAEGGPMDGGAQPPMPPTPPSASATEATIWVSLPAEAKVFVNDRPTTSTGNLRHYVSRGLERGRTYSYNLRVEFDRQGEPVVEDKLVRLQAGSAVRLAFGDQPAADQQTAKTELKLHVPRDAKVTLAGSATQQTGEVRTYATEGLKPGQKWDGYVVRVELEQDGRTLVEERTLSIEGGQTYELSFEMKGDAAQMAAM